MLAVSVSFVFDPLADIVISGATFPHTIAMFDAVYPFAIVSVSIDPSVQAFAIDAPFRIVTQVLVPVAESFITFAIALVVQPFTLVHTAYLIDADALALAETTRQLSPIKRLFVTLNREA